MPDKKQKRPCPYFDMMTKAYPALLTLETVDAGIVFHTKTSNVFDGQV